MTSPQHALWIRRGSHWQLALPLAALRDRLRRYGYTVYDIGNDAHLDHLPPEDHTPYSETGWPGTTPYGWVTAEDIMPPRAGSGLPSLQALGRQIHDDRNAGHAGVAWLKYMNWGPVSDRAAVHCEWEPNHVQWGSSDTGHIHLSGRSDHVTTATAAELAYDPVARLRGQEEDIMAGLTEEQQLDLYRRVRNAELILWYGVKGGQDSVPEELMAGTGAGTPVPPGAPLGLVRAIRGIGVTPTDEQWAALTAALVDKVGQAVAAALGPAALEQAAFDGAQRAERE